MDSGPDPTVSVACMLPYGSWPTPITSELVVRAAVGLGAVALDGDDIWWAEQRPEEGGRTELVRCRLVGHTEGQIDFHGLRSDAFAAVNADIGLDAHFFDKDKVHQLPFTMPAF